MERQDENKKFSCKQDRVSESKLFQFNGLGHKGIQQKELRQRDLRLQPTTFTQSSTTGKEACATNVICIVPWFCTRPWLRGSV